MDYVINRIIILFLGGLEFWKRGLKREKYRSISWVLLFTFTGQTRFVLFKEAQFPKPTFLFWVWQSFRLHIWSMWLCLVDVLNAHSPLWYSTYNPCILCFQVVHVCHQFYPGCISFFTTTLLFPLCKPYNRIPCGVFKLWRCLPHDVILLPHN